MTRTELLNVHTQKYLQSLRSPETLARILEVPVVRRLPAWVIDWRIHADAIEGILTRYDRG